MRKNIDIDKRTLTKLTVISVLENTSVKELMEQAVARFVVHKEQELSKRMTVGEKEDLGLLFLMQQVNRGHTGSEEEFFKALRKQ